MDKQEKLQMLQQVLMESHETVFLAGLSFMMGVLCTIFLLVVLDLLRVLRENKMTENMEEDEEIHATE